LRNFRHTIHTRINKRRKKPMTKKIMAKVGEYEHDGQTKGRYVEIGVIAENANGEFVLLNPSVNLAGVLVQQRHFAATNKKGKPGDMVFCSVFENNYKGGNGGGQKQYQQPQKQAAPPPPQQPIDDGFDDDIPF